MTADTDAAQPDPDEIQVAWLDEVSDTLAEMLAMADRQEGLEGALARLAETVLWVVEGADMVTVTVIEDGTPRTVATTSTAVLGIDRDQYAAGAGPTIETAGTGEPIRVSVDEAAERWPAFADAAERAGVHSSLSAPLILTTAADDGETDLDEIVGVLNVYGRARDAFDRLDTARLRLLCTTAVASISAARNYLGSRRLVDQLRNALVSRAEIDQAKGALMAVHSITADEAFDMLARQSQQQNVRLVEIARQFLDKLAPRDDEMAGG